jgi:heptosyltransferase-2
MVGAYADLEAMSSDTQNVEVNTIVCVPNWLGDSIMSMPALHALKSARPDTRITILVKAKLRELWSMHPAVDGQIHLSEGVFGVLRTAHEIRRARFREAYVLPNSFRSAWIPFVAGVPERVGQLGHRPEFLLTHIVDIETRGLHQGQEYMRMLGLDERSSEPHSVDLQSPENLPLDHLVQLEDAGPVVGMLPGSARGPSKQWPMRRYVEVGKWLVGEFAGCRLLVLGTGAEESLCEEVTRGIGERTTNLAGKTSLTELVALMKRCRTVVCNDSGGMHLAAASGIPVVAVFGITDPEKTGPMGRGHRLIFRDDVTHRRDVERDSKQAREVLESIEASSVIDAVSDILYESS